MRSPLVLMPSLLVLISSLLILTSSSIVLTSSPLVLMSGLLTLISQKILEKHAKTIKFCHLTNFLRDVNLLNNLI